jgi:hypothetical protein
MSALQELRGVLNKQLWVLVLRTMIATEPAKVARRDPLGSDE